MCHDLDAQREVERHVDREGRKAFALVQPIAAERKLRRRPCRETRYESGSLGGLSAEFHSQGSFL
jgi:hypothetical protein